MFRKSLIVLTLGALIACNTAPAGEGEFSGQSAPPGETLSRRFLPKFETVWEQRELGKADSPSQVRYADIYSYRITQAPSSTVRFAGEFEPTGHLLVGWVYGQTMGSGSLDQFFVDIIVGAWGTTTIVIPASGSTQSAMRTKLRSALTANGIDPNQVNDSKYLRFISMPIDSVWARDYGPQPVLDGAGALSFIDTRYYEYRVYDDKVPTALAQAFGINVFRPSYKNEGGNFQSNGDGECFTSTGALYFNAPSPDKAAQQSLFKKYFGCKRVTFLQPLEGEGTTHIDMFMMVIGQRDIVVGQYAASDDCVNRDLLERNVATIQSIKGSDGQPYFRVHRVPMPPNKDGIWRTYTNFQMVRSASNPSQGRVLVPVYSGFSSYQSAMLSTLQQAFKTAHPGVTWTIQPINSDLIIQGNGAIHCVVHEIPAGKLQKTQSAPSALCGNAVSCDAGGCGNVSTQGYCDGNNVVYCQTDSNGNKLGVTYYPCGIPCQMSDGSACERSCGYNSSKGYYDCMGKLVCGSSTTTTVTPPTSTTPPVSTTPPSSDPCGGVDYAGKCSGNTVIWCENQQLQQYDCAAVNKGCAYKSSSQIYDCVDSNRTNTTPPNNTDPCQGITAVGVCDGDSVYFCQNQTLYYKDCSSSNQRCDWVSTKNWYGCTY